MVTPAFYADERAPEGTLWHKQLTGDESRSLALLILACNLGSQRQKEFVQQLFRQKASHLSPMR